MNTIVNVAKTESTMAEFGSIWNAGNQFYIYGTSGTGGVQMTKLNTGQHTHKWDASKSKQSLKALGFNLVADKATITIS